MNIHVRHESSCATTGHDAASVVIDSDLSGHGPERIVELEKSDRLGVAKRNVKEDREHLLFEEPRVKLERRKDSRDESAPSNPLLEVFREHVRRKVRRHAVPPIWPATARRASRK